MTAEQLVTLLGLLITATATIVVSVVASRSSKKVSKEQNAVTFSQHLIDRIEGLEKRNDDLETRFGVLEKSFTTAINFIERMVLWARGGSKPPMPSIPKSLMSHFDPSLIEEHLEHQEAE